jgi:hypothetical protein
MSQNPTPQNDPKLNPAASKGANPATAKYQACGVRTSRWHLVSPDVGKDPHWMHFDVEHDYGEANDVKADYPDVVRQLGAQFDAWVEFTGWVPGERTGGRSSDQPFQGTVLAAVWWRAQQRGPTIDGHERNPGCSCRDPEVTWVALGCRRPPRHLPAKTIDTGPPFSRTANDGDPQSVGRSMALFDNCLNG